MQTIVSFQTADNPHDIFSDYTNYRKFMLEHHKTHILHGCWNIDSAIKRAKHYGAIDGSIRISYSDIYKHGGQKEIAAA